MPHVDGLITCSHVISLCVHHCVPCIRADYGKQTPLPRTTHLGLRVSVGRRFKADENATKDPKRLSVPCADLTVLAAPSRTETVLHTSINLPTLFLFSCLLPSSYLSPKQHLILLFFFIVFLRSSFSTPRFSSFLFFLFLLLAVIFFLS